MSINLCDSTISVAKLIEANVADYCEWSVEDKFVCDTLGISHATYRRALRCLQDNGAIKYYNQRPGPVQPPRLICLNPGSWVWVALGCWETTSSMTPDIDPAWLQ
jgi:hypothetical protein